MSAPTRKLRCEIVVIADDRQLVRVLGGGRELPDAVCLLISAPGRDDVRVSPIAGPAEGATGFAVNLDDVSRARLAVELPDGEQIELHCTGVRRLGADADDRARKTPTAARKRTSAVRRRAAQAGDALLTILPGGLLLAFSFNAGGYFPGTTALAVVFLLLALALRALLSDHPFAGLSVPYLVVATALGLFACWTLVSSTWSDAPARALVEYDRALLYAVGFVLLGTLAPSHPRLRRMVRSVAAGAAVVCCCALVTRLLPGAFPIEPSAAMRFAFPLTYWNALGLMAALGFVLCFALTCDEREPAESRALGAAALPVLAVTLLLTFSRGALAVAIIGLLAFVVVGRPRALLSGLLVAVPTVWVAMRAGYGADQLATENAAGATAAAQGEDVALIVMACVLAAAAGRVVLLRLDEHLAAIMSRVAAMRPGVRWSATATAVLGVAALGLALSLPSKIGQEYERFIDGSPVDVIGDLRPRLTRSGDNGRLEQLRIATADFRSRPLEGTGAGTYALKWELRRQAVAELQDAHSLYAEVIGELGIVGLLLLVTALMAILGGFLALARGPDRAVGGVLFATGLMWLVHAGVEWDWEMPAVSFWFFALGGAALAARGAEPRVTRLPSMAISRTGRLLVAVGCLALIVVPLRVAASERPLRESQRAFATGDCLRASDRARTASAWLGARPEPYVVVGYCELRRGRGQAALDAFGDALRRDPANWEMHYGFALGRAAAGRDPRPRLRVARRLNPLEVLPIRALELMDSDDARVWKRRAVRAALPAR